MWDADLGGSPAAICRYCKGDRQQYAPRSPRPTRVAARTARGGRSSACALGRRCDPAAGQARRIESACLCTPPRSHPRRRGPAPRSGAQAAALPSLTISTYGLPRAPCIRSVLVTTHHAPIYEIGSAITGLRRWRAACARPRRPAAPRRSRSTRPVCGPPPGSLRPGRGPLSGNSRRAAPWSRHTARRWP
jgi:hypothetical protein